MSGKPPHLACPYKCYRSDPDFVHEAAQAELLSLASQSQSQVAEMHMDAAEEQDAGVIVEIDADEQAVET